jgi:hypothetical protein
MSRFQLNKEDNLAEQQSAATDLLMLAAPCGHSPQDEQ